MKHEKSYYQDLNIGDNFKWAGYWKNMHHFSAKHPIKNLYTTISCTEEDLEDGNINDMVKYGVTK